jgi:hypothetical protein
MSHSTTVLVYCEDCTDGTAPDGLGCVMCSAMGHIAVNRTPEGDVPAPFREWMPSVLPSLLPHIQRCVN